MRENKRRQMKRYLMSVLTLALSIAVITCGMLPAGEAFAADGPSYRIIEASAAASEIENHGNLVLRYEGGPLTISDLNDAGYEYGDMVTITIGEQRIDMPLGEAYTDVEQKMPVISAKDTRTAKIALNKGDFATTYNIATKNGDSDNYYWTFNDGYSDPAAVTISMKEKGGYADEYDVRHLHYTDRRADFGELTYKEFANFREIRTTGIRHGILYRTSSPVDASHKRNIYADEAIREAGVTVVMNLTDPKDGAKNQAGYEGSYYSTTDYIELDMGVDYTTEEFKEKLADGLRYFASKDGVYAVHSREGKDRTGYVCALIECFMGASYDEVIDDYMKTFTNYYKVQKGDKKYELIVQKDVNPSLEFLLGEDDLSKADLAAAAEKYFKEIGLTDEELSALRENLSPLNNPLAVKAKTAGLKYSSLKTKSRTLKKSSVVKLVNKGEGKISYSITSAKKGKRSFKKHFKIDSKTGKLTVKKGLKKGTYKVRIKVSASGNGKYKAGSKEVTFKLKVR